MSGVSFNDTSAKAAVATSGTWTPVLSFDTVGNLSVGYTIQSGKYTKTGKNVTAHFAIVTSSFTHTTASGNLRITGLPFQCDLGSNFHAVGTFNGAGITKSGYAQINTQVNNGNSFLYAVGYQSGASISTVSTSDMPTGGSVILRGSISYMTDS